VLVTHNLRYLQGKCHAALRIKVVLFFNNFKSLIVTDHMNYQI
jgi:hypothetical protein